LFSGPCRYRYLGKDPQIPRQEADTESYDGWLKPEPSLNLLRIRISSNPIGEYLGGSLVPLRHKACKTGEAWRRQLTQAYSHLRSAKSDDTSAAEFSSVVQRQKYLIPDGLRSSSSRRSSNSITSWGSTCIPIPKTGGHVAGELEGFLLLDTNQRTSQPNQSNAFLET
jgi:hypothetical protein